MADTSKTETDEVHTLEKASLHHQRARKVFKIVQNYWSSLHSDHVDINKYIKNGPMLIYRSNQSLARKLVRANLRDHTISVTIDTIITTEALITATTMTVLGRLT